MSKLLYIAFNSEKVQANEKQKIIEICNQLNPDNITPNVTEVKEWNNIIYGINNPVQKYMEEKGSIFFGQSFGLASNWNLV
jgi:hypothetical protein